MKNSCARHDQPWKKGGYGSSAFCMKCKAESPGHIENHDAERDPVNTCIFHGPHFIVNAGFGDIEACLECVGEHLVKRCHRSGESCRSCVACKFCKKEAKKRVAVAQIEALYAKTYDETAVKLDDVSGFTRIKNAAQGK